MSLQSVILVPILVIVLAGGFALYLLVLRTVGDFANESIRSNLDALIANAISIADTEVDRQNREGTGSDSSATIEFQINARQKLEDFARDQAVGVIVLADDVLDFSTGLPDADARLIVAQRARMTAAPLPLGNGIAYYVRSETFKPWAWSVLVAEDARNFDTVVIRVRLIYLGTALGALMIAMLLAYWLRRLLVRPVYAIAEDLTAGNPPRYEGVAELQFLADRIGQMMWDQKAKTLHLETTLNSMSDGIAVFDRDMRLVFWNDRFASYYRYPPQILQQGTRYEQMMQFNIDRGDYGEVNAGALLSEMTERARNVTPPRFEVTRADGTTTEVKRARMPDGGFVTTYTDITDRKQRDRFAAASEAKSQFLQNMSHDLRKPIAAIIEDANLLARKEPVKGQSLDGIKANADHLLVMIEDILAMARIEAGQIEAKPADVQIAPLLAQAIRLSRPRAAAKGLALHLAANEDLSVQTDPRLVSRIVLNLVSNAIEYTAEGEVNVSAARDGNGIRIDVADTGPGISAHDLELVFEKFVRLAPTAGLSRPGTGLGLGLAISRELARLLNGRLTVSSTPGHGSTFSLHLPATTRNDDDEHPHSPAG